MKPSSRLGFVEPLEARIAPARYFVGYLGADDPANDREYNEAPFVKMMGALPTDQISTALGGDDRSYYLKLVAGDEVYLKGGNSTPYSPMITVSKGTMIVFFHDEGEVGTGLNEVSANEIQGISLGANVSATFFVPINGDVVTNYDDKTGTIDVDGLLGPKQGIGTFTVGGNINGKVMAGGNINGLTANGVQSILAGSANHNVGYDLLSASVGGDDTILVNQAAGEVGASISNIRIGTLGLGGTPVGTIEAGGGGVGGKGGTINQIVIEQDTTGFSILGGKGGNGAAGKLNGGIGGDVTNVYIGGVADNFSANDPVKILAGNGGDGAAGGNGGAGGKLTNVMVGFDYLNKKATPSGSLFRDNVEIASGEGGNGKTGGAGGALSKVNIRVLTPDSGGVVDEIIVRAGNGGDAVNNLGGGAGIGGSITGLEIRNQHVLSFDPDILIQAGSGGFVVTPAVANGGLGGSITDVTLLSFNALMLAGNGSDGKVGGKGGSVTKVKTLQDDSILIHTLGIEAGTGGDSANGAGAVGGKITDIKVFNSDLTSFTVNLNGGGMGGNGSKGKGGDGGAVTNIDVKDGDTGFALAGTADVRAGSGGSGTTGGGKGGELSKYILFGLNVGINAAAGSGGNATTDGAGGNGGLLTEVSLTGDGLLFGLPVDGTIQAGNGGNGAGKGAGGIGADIKSSKINVDGSVIAQAGAGGSGAGVGAAGRGGSIVTTGAFAETGSGLLQAGDAGAAGGKAGNGGSILGTTSQLSTLRAAQGVEVVAGDGTAGGNGGDIKYVVFGSAAEGLRPAPTGVVLVQAGNGSGAGTTAGKGGSIDRVDGTPTSGINQTTTILAGNGGSTGTKAGLGGSITNFTLTGVGDDAINPLTGTPLANAQKNPVTIVLKAGDAGDAANASTGVKGGDVKTVAISNLDPDAIVRSIAAGDGGDALNKGGLGGTIDNVRVFGGVDLVTGATLSGDIGYRSGQVFGYNTMGGLFAGAGGAATAPGLAGNVTNISADSIASIVAGRTSTPQLVEKVEKITLNGLEPLKTARPAPFKIIYDASPDAVPDPADDGPTTVLLGADGRTVDPEDVEAALAALAGVPVVDIVRTANATFQITGLQPEDLKSFTLEEHVPIAISESVPGQQRFTATEIFVGSTNNAEQQFFKPFTSGVYRLSFGASTTADIAFDADVVEVEFELNSIAAIANAGGVTVTGNNVAGFTVEFNTPGVRANIVGVADIREQQIIDPLGVGQFQIEAVGGTNPTKRMAANIAPADLKQELNDSGVLPSGTSVFDVLPGPNGSYIVIFKEGGDQPLLIGTEFTRVAAQTDVQGDFGTNVKEVQSLSFVLRNTFTVGDYNKANIVGAIADSNEIGSPVFKFTENGADPGFDLGDTPIDGIVMARILNQGTLNFTPQAKYVTTNNGKPLDPAADAFFDFDNKI